MGLIDRHSKSVPRRVRERREKVAMFMGKQFTQNEIAQLVGVSQTQVFKDMKAIKEIGDTFAYHLAKENGIAAMMMESIIGFQSIIHDLEILKARTFQMPVGDTGRVVERPLLGGNAMVAAHRVQMECYEKIFEMSKNGPFVLGLKKVQNDFEKIKQSADSRKDIDGSRFVKTGGVH